VAVLGVLGLLLLWWVLYGQAEAVVTIENQSGQAIARLRVTRAGATTEFHDLQPGAQVTVPARDGEQAAFAVDGELADGTLLRGRFSAVGADRPTVIILPRGEVQFRLAQKRSPFSLGRPPPKTREKGQNRLARQQKSLYTRPQGSL
jgi:hypothetical protein